jgi:ribosome maturation factor RimP
MALKLEEIRQLAERVAASHGLDVVDVEYQGGGGKHRTLRVFIEKNEAQRASLRERVAVLLAARQTGPVEAEQEGLAEDDQALEPGHEEQDSEVQDAGLSDHDADEAFLAGLPSVANLEFLSGITHGDCELFSRDFGTVLDVEELGPGTEYLLEVSSPGLDRRLTRAGDYRRFTGSLVKLQTFEAVAGNRHWQGRIAEMRGESVVLEVGGKSQGRKTKKGAAPTPETVEIALGNVEKANLVPEF